MRQIEDGNGNKIFRYNRCTHELAETKKALVEPAKAAWSDKNFNGKDFFTPSKNMIRAVKIGKSHIIKISSRRGSLYGGRNVGTIATNPCTPVAFSAAISLSLVTRNVKN